MPANAISGLISGIDSKAIVDSLINVQRASTAITESRRKGFQDKLDLTRTFSSKLLLAQLDITAVRRSSTYLSRTATSSNSAALSATASSSATPGTYSFTVEQAAQAHQIATAGFSSSSSVLGNGTFTFQSGNGAQVSLTLDPSNNTLTGAAAAINAANAGVKAQILNDGSANPYRLVLSSVATGSASTVTFDASGLTGGQSDQLKPVVAGVGITSTGPVTLGGIYTGTALPAYTLRVKTAGTEATAAFEVSTNGGTNWADVTLNAGEIDLGNGVKSLIGAGNYDLNDTWTLRPVQQLTAAQDAKIKFGTGASAISVTSPSNTLKDLVPGLILNITPGAAVNSTATITVGNDSEPAKKAVKAFVTSLNDAITFYRDKSKYDSTTRTAGALSSENTLRRGLDAIVRDFTASVPGLPSGLSALNSVGITVDKEKGTLILDEQMLATKLSEDPQGVSNLFTSSGTSSKAGIEFSALSDKTKINGPFTVNVTQVAAQASISGGALGVSTVIGVGNDRFKIAVNGSAREVVLAHGSYSRTALAEHLQSTINTALGSSTPQLAVSIGGSNELRFATSGYGVSQTVQILDASTANARTTLGVGLGGSSGVDVAGTINGVAALGNGQSLTGKSGTDADGLRLLVTSGATITGATITARAGLAQKASTRLIEMTQASTGTLTQRESVFTKIVADLDSTIKKSDERLVQRRRYLEAKFVEMEKTMGKYNNLSSYLSNQLTFNPDAGKK